MYHFSILKKEFYESIDQKIYHKIPLNPPLPRFLRGKRLPKGETLISSLWSPTQPPAQKSLWLGESGL